jgi:hypothetical protein
MEKSPPVELEVECDELNGTIDGDESSRVMHNRQATA